jgi:hypothetical protein
MVEENEKTQTYPKVQAYRSREHHTIQREGRKIPPSLNQYEGSS